MYNQKCYKHIGKDLSRQENTDIPEKTEFKGTLDENDGAAMLFYCWKAAKIF